MQSPHWSRLLAGGETHAEEHTEGLWPMGDSGWNTVPEVLYPTGWIHDKGVPEELQVIRKTHIGALREGLYPVEEIPYWSREQCEEEKATEMKCYQLTVTPILHPLVCLGRGQVVEELGVKLSLGVEGKWVLSCSSLVFWGTRECGVVFFSPSCSIFNCQ